MMMLPAATFSLAALAGATAHLATTVVQVSHADDGGTRAVITSGPRILWANVHEMQHAMLSGSGFSPTQKLSCRVVAVALGARCHPCTRTD